MKNCLVYVKTKDRVIYLFLFDILIYCVIIFHMTKGDIMAGNGMTWFDLFDTPEKRISFAKSAADQMMVQMKDKNMTIHHWCSEKKKEYTNEDVLFQYFDLIYEGLELYATSYRARIHRDEESLFLPNDGLQQGICKLLEDDIQKYKEALYTVTCYMNYLELIKMERENKRGNYGK